MLYSTSLYFGVQLFNQDTRPKHRVDYYYLNYDVFVIALGLEVVYWFLTRIVLVVLYMRTYSNGRAWYHNLLVLLSNSLFTFLPSEMLLFFGYHRHHCTDFEKGLLNVSWLRRIISSVRIIMLILVECLGANIRLEDDFISMTFLFQTVYLAMLIIAICPQASTYDNQTWYRRF